MGVISDTFSAALLINKKNIKIVVIFVLIIGMLSPLIDSLFIKPTQIQQEIAILKEINKIKEIEIQNNIEKRLKDDIEKKLEKYIENNQISINFINRYKNCPGKFYSGILLWLIVLVAALFQKQKWYMKIAMMLMIVLFILVVGYIGLLLPTIGTPWVNYFLYPILQIIFFISFLDIKLT